MGDLYWSQKRDARGEPRAPLPLDAVGWGYTWQLIPFNLILKIFFYTHHDTLIILLFRFLCELVVVTMFQNSRFHEAVLIARHYLLLLQQAESRLQSKQTAPFLGACPGDRLFTSPWLETSTLSFNLDHRCLIVWRGFCQCCGFIFSVCCSPSWCSNSRSSSPFLCF